MVLRSSKQAGTTNNAPEPSPGAEPSGAEPPHVRGNPNAPVTLEEFADFQCASCGYYYPELKKIEAEFGDRLRVIFRERPLVPPHEHALVAAQAAEAAGLQGEAHFWEMHDKLYEEQKAKKEIPLNEKKFLARRAEFDAQESEEKTFDEHERGASEVFKRDYYGNEVLSITLDYLRLLGKDKVAADARTTGRPN